MSRPGGVPGLLLAVISSASRILARTCKVNPLAAAVLESNVTIYTNEITYCIFNNLCGVLLLVDLKTKRKVLPHSTDWRIRPGPFPCTQAETVAGGRSVGTLFTSLFPGSTIRTPWIGCPCGMMEARHSIGSVFGRSGPSWSVRWGFQVLPPLLSLRNFSQVFLSQSNLWSSFPLLLVGNYRGEVYRNLTTGNIAVGQTTLEPWAKPRRPYRHSTHSQWIEAWAKPR